MVEEAPKDAGPGGSVPGVSNARTPSLDRFPIRTRESPVTLSAWRLSVECDEGEGAIVRIDCSAEERFYRGEGIFLGWSEERLASAYEVLRPVPDEPTFETAQLG